MLDLELYSSIEDGLFPGKQDHFVTYQLTCWDRTEALMSYEVGVSSYVRTFLLAGLLMLFFSLVSTPVEAKFIHLKITREYVKFAENLECKGNDSSQYKLSKIPIYVSEGQGDRSTFPGTTVQTQPE